MLFFPILNQKYEIVLKDRDEKYFKLREHYISCKHFNKKEKQHQLFLIGGMINLTDGKKRFSKEVNCFNLFSMRPQEINSYPAYKNSNSGYED